MPKLIYPTNSSDTTTAFDELRKDSYIIYHKNNFSLRPFDGITEENKFKVVAISGLPNWTQDTDYPKMSKIG